MLKRLMQGNASAIQHGFWAVWRNRALIIELTRRDISDRYAGQALGRLWTFAHPLFLMALYVFVFVFVFKTKIEGVKETRDYTTYILSGLIPWMAIQESMNRAGTAITANSGLVKQVVFPLEVLPIKCVLSALLPQLISTAALFLYMAVRSGGWPATLFLWPLLITLQLILMVGIGFVLSALGTYFRDTKDFVQLFGVAGVYAAPIVYLPGWVPEPFRPLIEINPFTYVIYCYQDVFYFGRVERPFAWLIFGGLSIVFFTLGYRLFRKLKVGFGSAL